MEKNLHKEAKKQRGKDTNFFETPLLLGFFVFSKAPFEMQNVQGTIVGFYCPPYVQGLNVPGYHLHFITRDRSQGGHLLKCTLTTGTIQAEAVREFHMVLPANQDFAQTNLTVDRREELKKVESQ